MVSKVDFQLCILGNGDFYYGLARRIWTGIARLTVCPVVLPGFPGFRQLNIRKTLTNR